MDEIKIKKEKIIKLNFFKKIWYSITKFERYPEMAALGVKKTLSYFTGLMLLFSIIYTGIYVYYITNIAEFDEPNLNLTQKVIVSLLDNEKNNIDPIVQMAEGEEYNSYIVIIIALFISVFVNFYIITMIDVFTLSVFGILTCFIAKIKMNYKAVFNMSIFALTLSIILKIIYIALNMLAQFEMKYFDVMYIAVSYISLAAAIFLIKSDVIKQHLELMKILEESKEKIEQTITIPKRPKEDEEKKDDDKDGKKSDDEKQDDKGTEEQGSNA